MPSTPVATTSPFPSIGDYFFRPAREEDVPSIWAILQAAIASRKADGSDQWQNGYPNEGSIARDMENGWAYVMVRSQCDTKTDGAATGAAAADGGSASASDDGIISGYCALIYGIEPAYLSVTGGQWLTDNTPQNTRYAVVHRVATLVASSSSPTCTVSNADATNNSSSSCVASPTPASSSSSPTAGSPSSPSARRGNGLGTTLMQLIEAQCGVDKARVDSIRADTNYDNHAMMRLFAKLGYAYCGEVDYQGAARKGYEKVLVASAAL